MMSYFLAFCGLILIALTGPSVVREWFQHETLSSDSWDWKEIPPVLLEYLQTMEDRIGALTDALVEMAEAVDKAVFTKPTPPEEFTEVLHQNKQDKALLTINEKIYQAFLDGKNITELAQEFGRGKGEIELILNLKR
jgi:hypothetical protein